MAVVLLPIAGCSTKAGTGALIGGAGGAAVGAGIGSLSHARAGEGALIGAAVGTIAGVLIGNEMDKSDRQKEERWQQQHYDQQRRVNDASYGNRSTAPQPTPITKDDVISWSARGVKDEIIIDRIQRGGTVFYLTPADEDQLRDAGVSGQVIQSMKDTARR